MATSTAELQGIIVKDPSDPTTELIRDFYVTFCYIKVQTGLTGSHRPDQSGLCWDQFFVMKNRVSYRHWNRLGRKELPEPESLKTFQKMSDHPVALSDHQT